MEQGPPGNVVHNEREKSVPPKKQSVAEWAACGPGAKEARRKGGSEGHQAKWSGIKKEATCARGSRGKMVATDHKRTRTGPDGKQRTDYIAGTEKQEADPTERKRASSNSHNLHTSSHWQKTLNELLLRQPKATRSDNQRRKGDAAPTLKAEISRLNDNLCEH